VARPVRKVILPSDLEGVRNGQIPPRLLRPIAPTGRLHHLAADAWQAMRAAALADGVRPFKPTSSADTYRPLADQRRLFLARYTLNPLEGRPTVVWEGKTYYLLPRMAQAARPGTSNHGYGIAVDVWGSSGARLEWLEKNALRFGFSWEFRSGAEPWHIRYFRGDKVPPAVRRWKEAQA
jgi:LAS superfamily LD-carboxypeptidase LdcB